MQCGVVVLGVGILALASAALAGRAELRPPALFACFGILYLAVARFTGRGAAVAARWHPNGLPLAGAALVAGVLLHLAPHVAAGGEAFRGADLDRGLSALAPLPLALTVCTVAWEELWFRGPVLEAAPAGRGAAGFAAGNGVLFAALHLLNPEFRVAVEGPEILAAGAFLTAAYFASGSFLVPLAAHLGNNLAGAALRAAADPAAAGEAPAVAYVRAALLVAATAALLPAVIRRTAARVAVVQGGAASNPRPDAPGGA
jgi:membrane protease YdiL (CAAX protease family)